MRISLPRQALVKAAFFSAFAAFLLIPGSLPGQAERTDRGRLVSFGLDPQDYNEVAAGLSSSIRVEERLADFEDRVLVIGPVDTEDCYFAFDEVLLQERIQTAIQRSGILRVYFAANVIPEESAQRALRNITELNYYAGNEEEATDDLRHLATLSEIDYLLFGRVSSIVRYHRDYKEVTYVFNWKIGNTRTGLIEWTDEMEFTKSGDLPEVPQWYVETPEDSSRNLYGVGYAADSSEREAIGKAVDAAAQSVRAKLNREYAEVAWMDGFGEILSESMLNVRLSRTRTERRERQAWVLVRLGQHHLETYRNDRDEAIDFMNLFETDLADARQAYVIDEYVKAYRSVRDLESRLDRRASDPGGVFLRDRARFLLADFEADTGNPGGARRHFREIVRSSGSAAWRDRAAARLNEIVDDEESVMTSRVRALFGGENILVLAAYRSEDDAGSQWRKAEASVTDLLTRGWGDTVNGRALAVSWISAPDLASRAVSLATEQDARAVFFFAADGKFETRENEGNPLGEDVRFTGDLTIGFIGGDRNPRTVEQRVFTGWNRFGREMCMDMLAIQGLKLWETRYLEEN